MRTIRLDPVPDVPFTTRQRAAPPSLGALCVNDDAILLDAVTGDPVAAVSVRAVDLADRLGMMLRHVEFAERPPRLGATTNGGSRLSGIAVSNSTFGYLPPAPTKRRYGCSRCAFDAKYPDVMPLLAEFMQTADGLLDLLPGTDEMRAVVRERIAPAWLLSGTAWTEGIINNNAALPYHRDSSNVPGMWSGLLAIKRSCEGGWLHFPGYGVYLGLPNGAVAVFDGGKHLHGVTPFRLSRPDGYRYSIVSYARAGMAACAPDPADEHARASAAAAAAARARLAT